MTYTAEAEGYKREFLRFNVTGDSWEALADAPKGKASSREKDAT